MFSLYFHGILGVVRTKHAQHRAQRRATRVRRERLLVRSRLSNLVRTSGSVSTSGGIPCVFVFPARRYDDLRGGSIGGGP